MAPAQVFAVALSRVDGKEGPMLSMIRAYENEQADFRIVYVRLLYSISGCSRRGWGGTVWQAEGVRGTDTCGEERRRKLM